MIVRTAVAAVAITVCTLGVASTGSGATLMRIGAESTSYASADKTRVWNVSRRQQRVRVNLVAQETIRPFTYNESYDRVYGPNVTRPTRGSGSVRLECLRTKRSPWYSSTDTYCTIIANKTTTIRIPLRNAARCRIAVSISAQDMSSIANEEIVGVAATAVVTTVR